MSLAQMKNRLVTWLYHVTHGLKKPDTTEEKFDHLLHCRHCREGFEKWKQEGGL